ncbi:MAG TPA: hypothetical protein VN894_01395 [Polyangiaceae bacterium]|nr:hypothetical protein [Polyangiaceae bacterium]
MWRSLRRLLLTVSAALGLGLGACNSDVPCGCLCAPQPDGAVISPCSMVGPPVDFDSGALDAPDAPE